MQIMETKKQITKSYLNGLVEQALKKQEIHEKIIEDFNLNKNFWTISDTTKLFQKANISLKAKPRKKKIEFEIID